MSERGSAFVTRAWTQLRQGGAAGFAWAALRSLGIHRQFLLTTGAGDAPAGSSSLPLDCARLGSDEIGEYLAFRPDQAHDAIHRRLRDGDECFVARHEGRLVAAIWTARGSVWLDFLAHRLWLAEGVYFNHDLFVSADLRGKRVADTLTEFRSAALREAGFVRRVALYERENHASTRRSLRRENRVIARLECLRLGPWQRIRLYARPGEEETLVRLTPGA